MLSKAIFTIGLAVVAMITIASAIPTSNNVFEERAASTDPAVELCTGNIGTGCVTMPVTSDICINFIGGFAFLDKEVSAVVVPRSIVCTFFTAYWPHAGIWNCSNFACFSLSGGSQVVLQSGTWSFSTPVPGTGGNVNFNDQASSFSCSAV
ncbi:hypothetical protein CVT25_000147 [Psilocybe cyanescens]|uniref:Uncharacterized protein n=1 Tax=Psilocybe cyanescens TaxID=93625 RepID=A0A409X8X0_PSICY|nr:hypothetical protein CVT25_000147 [Psilocybe cyanescens]